MTEFHADDYGLFPAQSGRILDCWREGALNGTSLMPNSPCLDECLDMLPPEGIALTVHLNLIEGRCLAPKEALPLLVDDRGVFRVSFSSLLFSRFTGKYREYRREIKMELSAQIRALRSATADHLFRLLPLCRRAATGRRPVPRDAHTLVAGFRHLRKP